MFLKDGGLQAVEPKNSDNFMMYCYKVNQCPIPGSHEWSTCPYAHSGEHNVRRSPLLFQYSYLTCKEMKSTGSCARGSQCPFAHNMRESCLHPSRYRTSMCHMGQKCNRIVCYFAHTASELRLVDVAETLQTGSGLPLNQADGPLGADMNGASNLYIDPLLALARQSVSQGYPSSGVDTKLDFMQSLENVMPVNSISQAKYLAQRPARANVLKSQWPGMMNQDDSEDDPPHIAMHSAKQRNLSMMDSSLLVGGTMVDPSGFQLGKPPMNASVFGSCGPNAYDGLSRVVASAAPMVAQDWTNHFSGAVTQPMFTLPASMDAADLRNTNSAAIAAAVRSSQRLLVGGLNQYVPGL